MAVLGVLALSLNGAPAGAAIPVLPPLSPCDTMEGAGRILNATGHTPGASANFGIEAGCKRDGRLFGHLEYIDRGTGLRAHGISVTAYSSDQLPPAGSPPDPRARFACGTATTNLAGHRNVVYVWRASDHGESEDDEDVNRDPSEFDIQFRDPPDNQGNLGAVLYTTGPDSGRFPHAVVRGENELERPHRATTGGGGPCPGF